MTDFSKRLGYGGSATIDGVQVLITGGSLEQADAPSFLEMYDIDPTGTPMDPRGRVLHADGVSAFTGNISFDLTKNIMDRITVSRLLARGYKFNVGICDGSGGDSSTDVSWTLKDCYLTNFTMNGSPGGVLNASMAIMSKDPRDNTAVTNEYVLDDYYGTSPATDNQPIAYWWSGGPDVKEWTLTMNQSVEPVYLNTNPNPPLPDYPHYLKVGLVDYQLDVVLYNGGTPDTIIIHTASFTLKGVTSAKGYSFNGVTDLGMYSHSFTTAASAATGSGDIVIT